VFQVQYTYHGHPIAYAIGYRISRGGCCFSTSINTRCTYTDESVPQVTPMRSTRIAYNNTLEADHYLTSKGSSHMSHLTAARTATRANDICWDPGEDTIGTRGVRLINYADSEVFAKEICAFRGGSHANDRLRCRATVRGEAVRTMHDTSGSIGVRMANRGSVLQQQVEPESRLYAVRGAFYASYSRAVRCAFAFQWPPAYTEHVISARISYAPDDLVLVRSGSYVDEARYTSSSCGVIDPKMQRTYIIGARIALTIDDEVLLRSGSHADYPRRTRCAFHSDGYIDEDVSSIGARLLLTNFQLQADTDRVMRRGGVRATIPVRVTASLRQDDNTYIQSYQHGARVTYTNLYTATSIRRIVRGTAYLLELYPRLSHAIDFAQHMGAVDVSGRLGHVYYGNKLRSPYAVIRGASFENTSQAARVAYPLDIAVGNTLYDLGARLHYATLQTDYVIKGNAWQGTRAPRCSLNTEWPAEFCNFDLGSRVLYAPIRQRTMRTPPCILRGAAFHVEVPPRAALATHAQPTFNNDGAGARVAHI
jgi:hypothetical protein